LRNWLASESVCTSRMRLLRLARVTRATAPSAAAMVSESQTNRAATSTRMTVMAIGVVLEYSIMIFRCP